jgi:hypothetical protein
MRTRPQLARVLVLIALFAVVAAAPGLAGTASVTPLPAAASTSAAPAPAAAFLATLTADLSGVSAPLFAVDCRTTFPNCPGDQLCCLACGYFGCDTYACFEPVNGHCPRFP